MSRVKVIYRRANGSEESISLAKARWSVDNGYAYVVSERPYIAQEHSIAEYMDGLQYSRGRQMSGVTRSLLGTEPGSSPRNEGMQQRRVRPQRREKGQWEQDFEKYKREYFDTDTIVLSAKKSRNKS